MLNQYILASGGVIVLVTIVGLLAFEQVLLRPPAIHACAPCWNTFRRSAGCGESKRCCPLRPPLSPVRLMLP